MKRGKFLTLGLVFFAVALTGCATGRNYSTDIDALNGRISALEGQLTDKNAELLRLQADMGSQSSELDAARRDKAELQARLDSMMSQLESKTLPKPAATPAVESDLK